MTKYRLGDVLTIIMDYRGKTPKKLGLDWTEDKNDIVALSAKNLKNGELINLDKSHYGNSALYNKWMKDGDISVGDILMTSEAPLGELFLVDKPIKAILSQRIFLLRPNNSIVLPWYLYFYMSSKNFQNRLNGHATGTTVIGIKQKELRNIEIELPSLSIQKSIVRKLVPISKKIEINKEINANLLKQLKLSFNNLYLSLTDDKTFTLGELIFENISGDWGKAQSQGDFTNRVTIIRGADIDDLALGNSAKTPIRYIKNRALVNKHLLPNDVLVEISGGSPTQSTGRSLLVSDSVIDKFSSEVLGTNFTRIFRPSSEENSILFKSYLDFLYDKDVFFNYENGTTGIKNLDYKSVLKIQLPDIRKANNYQQYINLYKLYNNTVQSNGRQSVQLTKIRQAMLNNFF